MPAWLDYKALGDTHSAHASDNGSICMLQNKIMTTELFASSYAEGQRAFACFWPACSATGNRRAYYTRAPLVSCVIVFSTKSTRVVRSARKSINASQYSMLPLCCDMTSTMSIAHQTQ